MADHKEALADSCVTVGLKKLRYSTFKNHLTHSFTPETKGMLQQ